MKAFSKDNWIPTAVSLPDTPRIVIIQTAELPDPSIGSFWADKGGWIFEEKDYEELGKFTVLAWRDMPDKYIEEDEALIFRLASEARLLSFNAQKRIKKGNYNAEYYEVREKILHATTQGLWELYLPTVSEKILDALVVAGYDIIKEEHGYTISWK